MYLLSICFATCIIGLFPSDQDSIKITKESTVHSTISEIPLPQGFHHVLGEDSLFAEWLLRQPLRNDNTVYLYNGEKKANQNAQFAVLDIIIGKKDLVQCADAVMKLRADFLFEAGMYSKISFRATSGESLSFSEWLGGNRWKMKERKLVPHKFSIHQESVTKAYQLYMDFVYSFCGTYSLDKQLSPASLNTLQPGDVFLHGGFPGHAVLVIAVAESKEKEKVFLLSQGFMPAQDIHILKNPSDSRLDPWYNRKNTNPLFTPEWSFSKTELKRW